MDHDPTLGEVYRLVEMVRNTQIEMRQEAANDRRRADEKYATKEQLAALQRLHEQRFLDDEKDITHQEEKWATQQDRNRQIVIGVIVGFLIIVGGIIANALGFTTGGA